MPSRMEALPVLCQNEIVLVQIIKSTTYRL